jgi:hypothetical protein
VAILHLTVAWFLGAALAAPTGGPWTDDTLDPVDRAIDRIGRATEADLLYGARSPGPLGMAYRWARVAEGASTELGGIISGALGPEIDAAAAPGFTRRWSDPPWSFRPSAGLAVGNARPALQSGDTEPGWASLRGRFAGVGYPGMLELAVTPEVRIDAFDSGDPDNGPTGFTAVARTAWAGVHTDLLRVGFGVQDRWFGPGRYGGLMLTDNARPAPMGSVAIEGRIFERFGRARAEVGGGWLDGYRTDVFAPAWLLADLRWAPIPALELGATRMGIFGGLDRPPPPLGQVILPTQPHVEGDIDQKLPDQDEIAALDARVTLPIGRWMGRKGAPGTGIALDYIEAYTQYGGEDIIARRIGPVPVPALAGIANLYGGEVGLGVLVMTIEHARILDDRFRWYRGHRVYHQGFVREGQNMAHPEGGDSRSTWCSVRYFPGKWGIEASRVQALRVGVANIEGDNLQALMADEKTQRYGIRGWWQTDNHGWLHAGAVVARTANPGFIPMAPEWTWRLEVGR